MSRRTSRAPLATAVFAAFLSSCATVRVVEHDDETGTEPPPSCVEPWAGTDLVAITEIGSATLIGDTLQIEGRIDDELGYAVIDLATQPYELAAQRADLLGGARWIHETGPYWVRLRGTQLEVLDAESPLEPALAGATDLGASPPELLSEAVSSDGQGVFLCLWSEAEQASFYARADLADPTTPAAPVRIDEWPCDHYGRGVARESLWVPWAPDGAVSMYDLTAAHGIDSHSFNTEGVHHYGQLTAVETDGAVVAATMENLSYAFLYYANQEPFVVYSNFGGGDKQLLAVAGGLAFVAFPEGDGVAVRAFDIATAPDFEQTPPQTPMDAALVGGARDVHAYRALSYDDSRLILSDGEALFAVPIGARGTVEPIEVVRRGAAPSCP